MKLKPFVLGCAFSAALTLMSAGNAFPQTVQEGPAAVSDAGQGDSVKENKCPEKKPKKSFITMLSEKVNLSGYAQTEYSYSSMDLSYDPDGDGIGNPRNAFKINRIMLILDVDLTSRLKMYTMYDIAKANLHEIWGEYTFHRAFKVKFGQFKNPFSIESNMSPSVVEQIRGSQAIQYLAGINGTDVCFGATAGRDLGLQASGSFLKVRDDHDLFTYRIGVFNGQGINMVDANNYKDAAGSLAVNPLKNWKIMGSFSIGHGHARADNPYGAFKAGDDYVRNRWGVGTEYTSKYISFRAEYLEGKDADITSRGAYALANVHVLPFLDVILSYDYLNRNVAVADEYMDYIAGVQWNFYRKCRLQLQYLRQERIRLRNSSDMFIAQLQVGF